MKKNLDKLYFGSLVPVTELNEIIQIYHNGLASNIYKASRLEISPSQTSLEIRHSVEEIRKKWKSYESHFKRDDELEYLGYVALEIKYTNEYFMKLYKFTKKGKDLRRIKLNILEKKVSFIHKTIQKLINYEVDVAHYERKKFLTQYEKTKKQLGTALFLIILTILLISMYVFRSIQKDHTRLEIATTKIKKMQIKSLRSVSYMDSLTSLHNRRYFNLVYEREIKRARRKNSYITFMMLDVDFFKQYNDTYGHIEGDYALQSVAKVLQSTLQRPSDYVFRLGGEEFGVLLTDTDESNSAKLARDICDAVRDKKLKHEKSSVNEFVTISIGLVCCIADDALDEQVLISRADEMLYEAKRTGRDRYIITSNVSSAKVKVA
ncbi:MAG: GGDEF domain-containing protein [Sulfurimonas sp.]|nr:GGDEF domain-containing protein [Sulfurimonas sp.]